MTDQIKAYAEAVRQFREMADRLEQEQVAKETRALLRDIHCRSFRDRITALRPHAGLTNDRGKLLTTLYNLNIEIEIDKYANDVPLQTAIEKVAKEIERTPERVKAIYYQSRRERVL